MKLQGKKIAILIAHRGTEEPEFAQPTAAVEQAGGAVIVISLKTGDAETVNNDLDPGKTFAVDKAIDDVSASDFDGLVIPGGCVGADTLRSSDKVVAFVRDFFAAGKPVAAICHAPWTLIEADQVRGRTLTSYPTLATDIRNAGGIWVDQGLVTSRDPNDLRQYLNVEAGFVNQGGSFVCEVDEAPSETALIVADARIGRFQPDRVSCAFDRRRQKVFLDADQRRIGPVTIGPCSRRDRGRRGPACPDGRTARPRSGACYRLHRTAPSARRAGFVSSRVPSAPARGDPLHGVPRSSARVN